jgi:hypothetical protein
MNIFSKRFESYYLCKIYKPAVIYHHVYQCYCVTGVASPRGKLEIQQAKEEQLEISASGEEVSVWDVGDCPVIKTWSLASVTLPPPSYQLAMKETSGSLSALQLETIRYVCQQLPDGSRAGFYIGDGPI